MYDPLCNDTSGDYIGPVQQMFERKIVIIFTQQFKHMFFGGERRKHQLRTLIWRHGRRNSPDLEGAIITRSTCSSTKH